MDTLKILSYNSEDIYIIIDFCGFSTESIFSIIQKEEFLDIEKIEVIKNYILSNSGYSPSLNFFSTRGLIETILTKNLKKIIFIEVGEDIEKTNISSFSIKEVLTELNNYISFEDLDRNLREIENRELNETQPNPFQDEKTEEPLLPVKNKKEIITDDDFKRISYITENLIKKKNNLPVNDSKNISILKNTTLKEDFEENLLFALELVEKYEKVEEFKKALKEQKTEKSYNKEVTINSLLSISNYVHFLIKSKITQEFNKYIYNLKEDLSKYYKIAQHFTDDISYNTIHQLTIEPLHEFSEVEKEEINKLFIGFENPREGFYIKDHFNYFVYIKKVEV